MSSRFSFMVLLGGLVAVSLAGCAKKPEPAAVAENTEADHDHEGHDHAEGDHDHAGHDHAEGEHADHDHESTDAATELAKLTPEEREIAKAQGDICPVSDHGLGTMGAPVLVKDVDGKDVYICCAGCEDPLRKDPAKFLAKLKKQDEAPK